MSSLEFLKLVHAEKNGDIRFTPIIMITSGTRREKVILARNCGVMEYVAKPFNAKSPIPRVREVIERPRPFVDIGAYFGPDRRRRAEAISEGAEKRDKGGPRPASKEDMKASLTQEQIDKLVTGGAIKD